MIGDDALKEILLALADNAKTQYTIVDSLLAEVEALRETVRILDPTFLDVITQKRADAFERSTAVRKAVTSGHDAILDKVKYELLR